MKNIDIVRGYRSFGHEDVYASNPAVVIVEGDIIDANGDKVTLTDAHIECGIAIERNTTVAAGQKPSMNIPVYISNFVVRTTRFTAGTYAVGDAMSVAAGLPIKVDATNTVVWGYVTKVGTDGSLDIRCNY